MKHSVSNKILSAKSSEYNIYLVDFERRQVYSRQSSNVALSDGNDAFSMKAKHAPVWKD